MRDVVNVAGTGDDCFKWAILAGMHHVDVHVDRRGDRWGDVCAQTA